MDSFSDVGEIPASAFTIALIDDKPDSVADLESLLRSRGFQTSFHGSEQEIEEAFRVVLLECERGVVTTVPALDLRFDRALRLAMGGGNSYTVAEPQNTGLEILEQELIRSPALKSGRYLIMSSAPIDSNISARVNDLRNEDVAVESFRKADPEEDILKKVCTLLTEPAQVLITALAKSYESFCTSFRVPDQVRHIPLGASNPHIPNTRDKLRRFIIDSQDARDRIATLTRFEFLFQSIYEDTALADAMTAFITADGRNAMEVVLSGDLHSMKRLAREVETILGGVAGHGR